MTQTAPSPRKEQARSRRTRKRLLDATIECLAEIGYGRLTTAEVARRAGVSRGAQIHHYRTKWELVRAAIEHLDRRRLAEFRERLGSLPPTGDSIDRAIETLRDVALGPLAHAELALFDAARADPELRAVLTPYVEGRRQATRELLRPQLGHLVDHADFDALTSTLFDALRGAASIRVLGNREEIERRQLPLLKQMVRDALSRMESAPPPGFA